MFDAHVDYGFYMVVVQGIDNRLSLLAIINEPCVFQYAKLMRYCRHAHVKLFGDVANAHLALKKQIEDFDASAVAHYREKFSKIKEMLVVWQGNLIDYFMVCFVLATNRRVFMSMFHYILLYFDN